MIVTADGSNLRSSISWEPGLRVAEVVAFFGPGPREVPTPGLAGGSSFVIRAEGGPTADGSSLERRCHYKAWPRPTPSVPNRCIDSGARQM